MRTTVDLSPDLHAAVKSVALNRGTTMSEAVADLVRRGLGRAGTVRFGRSAAMGLPTARVGRTVTLDDVRCLEDEG